TYLRLARPLPLRELPARAAMVTGVLLLAWACCWSALRAAGWSGRRRSPADQTCPRRACRGSPDREVPAGRRRPPLAAPPRPTASTATPPSVPSLHRKGGGQSRWP